MTTELGRAPAAHRLYLLSPASCGGERARILLRDEAEFDLAMRLRSRAGVPLGEAFAFLSGLYFRGKLAYARAFASPPDGAPAALVITPCAGLVSPETIVRRATLRRWATIPIDLDETRYTRPLERDLRALERSLPADCEVVLLGSVSTKKYVEPLSRLLGDRVRYPAEFVGRGDMSRGGLMLRAAHDAARLTYVPLGATLPKGKRPPRLVPRPGILS